MRALVGESDVLAYQHTNTYSGHVEAVEKGLDVRIDLHSLSISLVFKDSLSDRRNNAVVPSFDVLESFRKTLVIVVQFGRPVVTVVGGGVVPAGGGETLAVAILARGVLPLLYAGVLSSVTEGFRFLTVALWRSDEAFAYVGRKVGSRKGCEFLDRRSDGD